MLSESVDALLDMEDVDVALSSAGEEVIRLYQQYERIQGKGRLICEKDQGKSSPYIMRLKKHYNLVIVAPATANTVAKIAAGVADSLVSNCVSQALKMGIEVRLLPTDIKREIISETLQGENLEIRPRDVDLDNIESIRGEVKTCENPGELLEP